MYEVQWAHPAVTDLRTKVQTQPVRRYLLGVARSSLDRHFPLWGGRTATLLWRRGVTVQDEAAAELGPVLDDGGSPQEQAHDFVLVYVQGSAPPPRRHFEVVAVYTNVELVAHLTAATPTPSPRPGRQAERRGRIMRLRGDDGGP